MILFRAAKFCANITFAFNCTYIVVLSMNTNSSLFIVIIHTVFTGDTVDAVNAPGTSLIRVDPSSRIVYYPSGSLLQVYCLS